MSRRYLHPWDLELKRKHKMEKYGHGELCGCGAWRGMWSAASLLQAWSAPPTMEDCFNLCSQVLVDMPCWVSFCNSDSWMPSTWTCNVLSNAARIGNSGRDWMAWLFSLIECLTTLPPSRKSSSLIFPTLITPLYWAQVLRKDPLYSLSSDKSKHLRAWQSRRPLEENLWELWTLYWSAPNSKLKKANLYTAWPLPCTLRPRRCSHKQWVVW